MAFQIKKLEELSQRIRNSFKTHMPGSNAWLFPGNLYVVSKVFAAIQYEINLSIQYAMKQFFATTADIEYLVIHGSEIGIDRKAASSAEGQVKVTGVVAYTVAVNTQFTRADGKVFQTTEAGVIGDEGFAYIPCSSVETGAEVNTVAGTPFTLVTTDANITALEAHEDGIGGGAPIEAVEDYRARVLERKRNPFHGGSKADYEIWAKQVKGVTRAWAVKKIYGPGTVGIYFMMDYSYADGVPLAADVTAVQTYIDSVAPYTATVHVEILTVTGVTVTIENLRPDTDVVRQSVYEEILQTIRDNAEPGMPDTPFTLERSWITQAASNAAGEVGHTLVAPATSLSFGTGIIPVLEKVEFK